VNQQLISDVTKFFTDIATHADVQVVLVSGEGKGFSAGTDLTALEANQSQQDFRRFLRQFQNAFTEIELLEKAVIALIHGFCFGAALELALACDIRICTPEARFNIPEVNMGIVPDGGGSQRLPRVVGLGRAKELILTGKTIDAQTADKWGLVNEVVEPEELERRGIAWAKEIMGNGPISVGLAKRNVDISLNMSISDGLECAGLAQSLAFSDPSFIKRVEQRFMDKIKNKKD